MTPTKTFLEDRAYGYGLNAQPDIEEAGRQAYLDAKAGKGLSSTFETVVEGKRWIAAHRRIHALEKHKD
jgi:hypothetical protein